MYHQRDMEESHKEPKVVPTVGTRDRPKTLETVEEYIRGFCGVYGKLLIYGLREDFIAPVAAQYPTYRANGSKYFTHNEEILAQGSIFRGHAVLETDPEENVPFTDSFIVNRAFIWDKMIAIFQIRRMDIP